MMLHCRERITPEQNKTLQSYKDKAQDFDSTQPDYAALLNFDLERYRVDESLPLEKQQAPVEMNQQENMMQTIVEVSIHILSLYFMPSAKVVNNECRT
jgi:hypothetical protein